MLHALMDLQMPAITWEDALKFIGCLIGLFALGTIQAVVAAVLGFGKKFQVLYAFELVGLTALVFWQGNYPLFQVGLPLALTVGIWKAFEYVGGAEEQEVLRQGPVELDHPVATRPGHLIDRRV